MVVAKRQGREKPSKIEQKKVKDTCKPMAVSFQCMTKSTTKKKKRRSKEGRSPTEPNLHRAGPGGRKKHKKRNQRALSLA